MESRLIGVISDTHALIRTEAAKALAKCDLIIHAGDIGTVHVIDVLRKIAPVVAVRGNCDKGSCAEIFASTEVLEIGGQYFYVIHDLNRIDIEPEAAGINIVINGHTHEPYQFRKEGVLYLNPGSAGPRRFSLPISLALLKITGDSLEVEFVKLAR